MEFTIEGYLQVAELFRVSVSTKDNIFECYMSRAELQGQANRITNVEEIE